MASLYDTITELLAHGDVTDALGDRVGGDEAEITAAVAAGVPAVIGGLSDRASRSQGAEAVRAMLDAPAGVRPATADDVAAFANRPPDDDDDVLDQIFGPDRFDLVAALARRSGVGERVVGQLLPTLAPVVLGVLAQRRRADGLDDEGVASLLAAERLELAAEGRLAELERPGSGGSATDGGRVAAGGAGVDTLAKPAADQLGVRGGPSTNGVSASGVGRTRSVNGVLWAVGAVALVLVLAWLLSRCDGGEEDVAPTTSSVAPAEDMAMIDGEDDTGDQGSGDGLGGASGAAAGDLQAAVDAALTGTGLDAVVEGDVVTVTGTVGSEDDRRAAVDAAAGVPGITAVADQIEVGETAGAGGGTGASPGDTLNELLDLAPVTFAVLSDRITPDGRAVLDEAAAFLVANDEVRIEIGGHTDDDGDEAQNLALSERRAESVKAYLVEQGIAADRLTTAGYGETRPKVPNDSSAGKAENRRIELTVR